MRLRTKKQMVMGKGVETTSGLPPAQLAFLLVGAHAELTELNLMDCGGSKLTNASAMAESAKKTPGSEESKFQAALQGARQKQVASEKWATNLKKLLAAGGLGKVLGQGLGRVWATRMGDTKNAKRHAAKPTHNLMQ